MNERAEKGIYEVFFIGIITKGIFAALEIILGTILIFNSSIIDLVLQLISDELIEDPSEMINSWVQPLLHPSAEAQVFGGLYLLSHGIVKMFLIIGLLRKKLWAYPASLSVFALFIMYQLFRYFFRTHSIWLLLITFFDVIIIWLIYHEYRRVLKSGVQSGNGPLAPGKA